MSCLLRSFLVLSLATLALSQEYIIATETSHIALHFTLDQLAQTDLTNGANLTLIFQPGKHTLRRLLSIGNFTHVEMIGQNTSVITLHDSGWIKLSDIDQLSIEGLTFTGHTTNPLISPTQRMHISNTQSVSIFNCSFSGLDTLQITVNNNNYTQNGNVLNLRNTSIAVIQKVSFKNNNGTALNINGAGYVSVVNSTFAANQYAAAGGAVYIGTVYIATITNSHFIHNNVSRYGGAIFVGTGKIHIVNSYLTGNTAGINGGGIIMISGTLSISHSKFTSNSADIAGGIAVYSGRASVYSSVFTGNSANHAGGIFVLVGIFESDSSISAFVSDTNFTDNFAYKEGGGIYIQSGNASISNCSFIGNSAEYGGGIVMGSGSVTITNSNLTGNIAEENAGGIGAVSGSVTISNTTLMDNTAYGPDGGGGIYLFLATVSIADCILTGNHAEKNGGAIRAIYSQIHINGDLTMSSNTSSSCGHVQL